MPSIRSGPSSDIETFGSACWTSALGSTVAGGVCVCAASRDGVTGSGWDGGVRVSANRGWKRSDEAAMSQLFRRRSATW